MDIQTINLIGIFITGSALAIAAGILGSFALLRRMALVADAMSHIALPGIALGLLFNFNILIGSVAFLLLGVIVIWYTEHKTKLAVDTLVGVTYTLALAIGAMLTPHEEILDALFGDITKLTNLDFIISTIFSIIIIYILLKYSKRFVLSMISSDLALSLKIKPHLIELGYLIMFAITVAIGIKFIGALLMGSLIIIPAATSRNIAKSFKSYMLISALLGLISINLGIILSQVFKLPPGPIIVVIAAIIFFLSVFIKKR